MSTWLPLCGIEWYVHVYTYMDMGCAEAVGMCACVCSWMGHVLSMVCLQGEACLRVSVCKYGLQCAYVRMDKPSPRETRVRLVCQRQ